MAIVSSRHKLICTPVNIAAMENGSIQDVFPIYIYIYPWLADLFESMVLDSDWHDAWPQSTKNNVSFAMSFGATCFFRKKDELIMTVLMLPFFSVAVILAWLKRLCISVRCLPAFVYFGPLWLRDLGLRPTALEHSPVQRHHMENVNAPKLLPWPS